MSSAFESLLGPTLLTKNDGLKATSEVLKDCDAVGLYFSAHWCPPCRQFTPMLAKTYEMLTGPQMGNKKFEIVFVSSDKDENQFNNYYNNEHPWTALPYSDRDRKQTISRKYKVSGIPSLIILDGKTGQTITTKGRSVVIQQPENFPWIPPTLKRLLGNTFVSNNTNNNGGTTNVSAESIKSKTLGLYFSAHWCGPCRGFTPRLVSTYKKIKEQNGNDNFEIIFISSDQNENEFHNYFNEMPWLALPYHLRDAKTNISDRFNVEGIPSLVIIGPEDNVTGERSIINTDARGPVSNDPNGLNFPWYPPLYLKLEEAGNHINQGIPTLVIMAEGCDDGRIDEIKIELEKVAKQHRDSGADNDEMTFAIAEPDDHIANQMRRLTKIGNPTEDAEILLIDAADGGAYYRGQPDDASFHDLINFITLYKSKALSRQQLG